MHVDVGVPRSGHAALCGAFFMSRSAFYHMCIHISTASPLFVFMAIRSRHINWPQSLKCIFFSCRRRKMQSGNCRWKQFVELYLKRYLHGITNGLLFLKY